MRGAWPIFPAAILREASPFPAPPLPISALILIALCSAFTNEKLMSADGAVISVRELRKNYGAVEAVRGIDFDVRAGEVFGLLGPNGAGKTTTVEILEGLRPRSGGDVRVLGLDPDRQKNELKDRVGVALQSTNLPDKMRVGEALELFAAFYSRTGDAEALLKRL